MRLPRVLPPAVANEVLIAGRCLDAAEAQRWGLVNAVVSADDLTAETRSLVARIVEAAPLSVAAISQIRDRTQHLPLADVFELLRSGDLGAYEAMLVSEDAAEGPRAFTEGRAPRWQGR